MDLLEGICHTNFRVSGQLFPLLRIALWATMLSTNKHQNNIQKLITKADIEKLRSPSYTAKIEELEAKLQASWKIAIIHADQKKATEAMGKLMIRSILLLLNKQKHSRESIQFEDQTAVLEAFSQEMTSSGPASFNAPAGAEEEEKPTDVMAASSKEIALMQYPHIKLNGKQLVHLYFLYSMGPQGFGK